MARFRTPSGSQCRGERGAFLLLFALLLVFFLTVVAFAVDLGQGRLQRRNNQQLVDLASLAAGQHLAGYGAPGSSDAAINPYGACVAAINSIQVNADDFRPTLSTAEIESTCGIFYNPYAPVVGTTECDSASPVPLTTSPVQRGPFELTIQYPVLDSAIADARFDSGIGANDGVNPCQRMKISLIRTDDTSFAAVIGIDQIRSRGSAVVRGTVDPGGQVIPAFLILERYRCSALVENNVGGDSLGIVVEAVDDQPGYIHVDTAAVPSQCSNSTTSPDGVAVYGTPLPDGSDSIVVESISATLPGVLSVVATGERAAYGDGYNVEPSPGEVISRVPVDDVFNDDENDAIGELHDDAYPEVSSPTNLGITSSEWVELGCDLLPTVADAADAASAVKWFVNCPNANFTSASATLITSPGGGLQPPTELVFSGNVSVANSGVLDASGPSKVVIRGSLLSRGVVALPDVQSFFVGNGIDIRSNGSLRVASEELPQYYDGPDDDTLNDDVLTVCDEEDTDDENTSMVVFFNDNVNTSRQALNVAGTAAFCETTIYLAGANSASNDDFRSRYDDTTSIFGCTSDLPCPANSTPLSNARFDFSGLVEWTAPNEAQGDDDPPDPRGNEDLMFWSEAERTSTVSGTLVSSGIFVAPNMEVRLQSPADNTPRNSQFIARRLFLLQGTLQMRPLPNDTIPIPDPGSYTIIR